MGFLNYTTLNTNVIVRVFYCIGDKTVTCYTARHEPWIMARLTIIPPTASKCLCSKRNESNLLSSYIPYLIQTIKQASARAFAMNSAFLVAILWNLLHLFASEGNHMVQFWLRSFFLSSPWALKLPLLSHLLLQPSFCATLLRIFTSSLTSSWREYWKKVLLLISF